MTSKQSEVQIETPQGGSGSENKEKLMLIKEVVSAEATMYVLSGCLLVYLTLSHTNEYFKVTMKMTLRNDNRLDEVISKPFNN